MMNKEEANQDVIAELKQNIKVELTICDPIYTPYVCQNIGTPAGYATIEALVLKKIVTQKLNIGEAIIEIENDLNPNSYND